MSQAPQPLVALLTDFGTSDPYVGVMKGVIATHCPAVQFIDVTHEVSPQNIKQVAYLLRSAYRYFPAHTIFLVVVDPGVGTNRQPVAITTDRGTFVGPDNGVFGSVLSEVETWQAVALWPPAQLSTTFHGRDVFAPAAAALANGADLHTLGTPTVDLIQTLNLDAQQVAGNKIEGEVLHIDHFGNVITSIGPLAWLRSQGDSTPTLLNWRDIQIVAAQAHITLAGYEINGIQLTYGLQPSGTIMALINSDNQLEIAVNQGNAAQITAAHLGDPVSLIFTTRSE